MPIGKVWIYRLLFVCVFVFCLFVRLRISPQRISPQASNFVRRFIGVQGRESQVFVNFAYPEAQNRTNRRAVDVGSACVNISPHRHTCLNTFFECIRRLKDATRRGLPKTTPFIYEVRLNLLKT